MDLRSTKNRTFHLRYPAKSSSLSQITLKKRDNENAAHYRPTFRIENNQKVEILGDFTVPSVIYQSRTHKASQVDRIGPKPGNSRIFQEIQMPAGLSDFFPAVSTRNRRKRWCARVLLRPCIEVKPGNHRIFSKSSKSTKI